MSEETKLELVTAQPMQVAPLIQKIVDSGLTKDNVDSLDRLLQMQERQEARAAQAAFNAAFSAMQAEMPTVVPQKAIPDKLGNTKYMYADYEGIMKIVKPMLLKYGFAIRFDSQQEDGRVTETCILMHSAGHSEKNSFTVRVGRGPINSSEAQADGAASTFAKRYALCRALNIQIGADTDAQKDVRVEGAIIKWEDAKWLQEEVTRLKANPDHYLRMAGVSSFDKVTEGSFAVLKNALKMREEQKKQ